MGPHADRDHGGLRRWHGLVEVAPLQLGEAGSYLTEIVVAGRLLVAISLRSAGHGEDAAIWVSPPVD